MRRIILLVTVAAVIVAMVVVTASPTFASHASEGDPKTGKFFGTCDKPGIFCDNPIRPSHNDEEEPPEEPPFKF